MLVGHASVAGDTRQRAPLLQGRSEEIRPLEGQARGTIGLREAGERSPLWPRRWSAVRRLSDAPVDQPRRTSTSSAASVDHADARREARRCVGRIDRSKLMSIDFGVDGTTRAGHPYGVRSTVGAPTGAILIVSAALARSS